MDYKGIKVPKKVIIVECTRVSESGDFWHGRTVNQGYVVDADNEKMLETAKSWASWSGRDDHIREEYFKHKEARGIKRYDWNNEDEEEKALNKKWEDSYTHHEGVLHEYENGNFKIALSEAAGGSSQGGKLSFWNCVITAPDGKEFLVGINQDLLLHLLMATTAVKGEIQETIWLGRVKGTQVGAFTEDMEEFKQAIQDEIVRTTPRTSKYVPGDIVSTGGSDLLYLGECYSYLGQATESRDRYAHSPVVLTKPKKKYMYISLETDYHQSYITLKNSKTAQIIVGHDESLLKEYLARIDKYMTEYKKLGVKKSGEPWSNRRTYFDEFIHDTCIRLSKDISPETIRNDLTEVIKYINDNGGSDPWWYSGYIKSDSELSADKYIITEDAWRFDLYDDYYKEGEERDVSFTVRL